MVERMQHFIVVMILLLGLHGCAQPPVPQDHYYRLPEPAVTKAPRLLDGTLSVQRLRTDGVYAQRPLLYTQGTDSVQLKQYHYHYWTDSPPRLLQDHLVAYLRGAGVATTTLADASGVQTDYRIDGRLRRFEQVRGTTEGAVVVDMELSLADARGAVLLVKDYRAELRISDDALPATVAGFDQALQQIYAAFITDLRTTLSP